MLEVLYVTIEAVIQVINHQSSRRALMETVHSTLSATAHYFCVIFFHIMEGVVIEQESVTRDAPNTHDMFHSVEVVCHCRARSQEKDAQSEEKTKQRKEQMKKKAKEKIRKTCVRDRKASNPHSL